MYYTAKTSLQSKFAFTDEGWGDGRSILEPSTKIQIETPTDLAWWL